MQVSRLASCLSLQAQSSSPTSAPAAISSISAHFFRATPSVFLETAGFFQITTPQSAIFALSTTPSQIPETARTAGRCDRRGARTTPRLCPAFPPQRPKSLDFALNGARATPAVKRSSLPCCSVAAACLADAPARWRNVRFSGFLVGTRSAGRRKRHKPPTRARRAWIGVLAVRSACVFNEIGIFSPCRVLGKLLHLPVIVLLERRIELVGL